VSYVQSSVFSGKFKSNLETLRSEAASESHGMPSTTSQKATRSSRSTWRVLCPSHHNASRHHTLVCRDSTDLYVTPAHPPSTVLPLVTIAENNRSADITGNDGELEGKVEMQESRIRSSEEKTAVTQAVERQESHGSKLAVDYESEVLSDDDFMIV